MPPSQPRPAGRRGRARGGRESVQLYLIDALGITLCYLVNFVNNTVGSWGKAPQYPPFALVRKWVVVQ